MPVSKRLLHLHSDVTVNSEHPRQPKVKRRRTRRWTWRSMSRKYDWVWEVIEPNASCLVDRAWQPVSWSSELNWKQLSTLVEASTDKRLNRKKKIWWGCYNIVIYYTSLFVYWIVQRDKASSGIGKMTKNDKLVPKKARVNRPLGMSFFSRDPWNRPWAVAKIFDRIE